MFWLSPLPSPKMGYLTHPTSMGRDKPSPLPRTCQGVDKRKANSERLNRRSPSFNGYQSWAPSTWPKGGIPRFADLETSERRTRATRSGTWPVFDRWNPEGSWHRSGLGDLWIRSIQKEGLQVSGRARIDTREPS